MKSRGDLVQADGRRPDAQPRAVALEHLRFEARMQAELVGQLAVVVHHRVERHVGIADVVREHRTQELDVVLRVGPLGLDVGEGTHQLAVHLLDAPRQQPVLLHHLLAELRDRGVLLVRDRVERRLAERVHVEEVLRRLFNPAGGAPQVRVDRVLGDEGAILDEEGPNLDRQQVDGAIGNQPVGLEAPGGGDARRRRPRWRRRRQGAGQCGRRSSSEELTSGVCRRRGLSRHHAPGPGGTRFTLMTAPRTKSRMTRSPASTPFGMASGTCGHADLLGVVVRIDVVDVERNLAVHADRLHLAQHRLPGSVEHGTPAATAASCR